VWIGLFLEEFLRQFYVNSLHRKTVFRLLSRWLVVIASVGILLVVLKKNASFIFDPTLGGRAEQLSVLSEWAWFGNTPFTGLTEITYLSILKNFGLVGLITFLMAITSPLWIPTHTSSNAVRRSVITGLVLYLFISCSDGAILYIPVMAFYWFLSAVLLARTLPYTSSNLTMSSSPKYSPV